MGILQDMNMQIFIPAFLLVLGLGIAVFIKRKAIGKRTERLIVDEILGEPSLSESISKTEVDIESIFSDIRDAAKKTSDAGTAQKVVHMLLNKKESDAIAQKKKQKALLPGAGLAVLMLLITRNPQIALFSGFLVSAIGYFIVMRAHDMLIKEEKEKAIDAIPDVLGYVSLLIDDMSLHKSLELVIENLSNEEPNILYESIKMSLNEAKLGRDLIESLAEKAELLDLQEWGMCIFTISEGIRIGKEISTIVKEVEAEFRTMQELRVRAEAAKVDTQISLATTLMFIPSLYLLIAGPIFLQIMKVL